MGIFLFIYIDFGDMQIILGLKFSNEILHKIVSRIWRNSNFYNYKNIYNETFSFLLGKEIFNFLIFEDN